MMNESEYLKNFESRLQDDLLRLCSECEMLDGQLLISDDIENRWHALAPEYVADAVPQIAQYPTVSVAWAAYLGMGVAHGWDRNWAAASQMQYSDYYGEQGFDDMDEHIVHEILGILPGSRHEERLETMVRRCAEAAVSRIRREQIEPQSPTAFHIFARAIKVLYRIGAALELKRLGYRFEKQSVGDC